jgi:hypothetical protein
VDLVVVLVNMILVDRVVVLREKVQPVFERMNPLYLC